MVKISLSKTKGRLLDIRFDRCSFNFSRYRWLYESALRLNDLLRCPVHFIIGGGNTFTGIDFEARIGKTGSVGVLYRELFKLYEAQEKMNKERNKDNEKKYADKN